jgi:NDP-sugar pyrophosphorylase family protein
MTATQAQCNDVSLFHATGAPQEYRLLESPIKKNQWLIQRLDLETPVACLEGVLPEHIHFQAYASRGGDVGVLHSGSNPSSLAYFLLPGATVQGNGFKISMFGETLPPQQSQQKTPPPASQQQFTKQAMILGAGLGTRILPLTEDYLNLAKPALPWVGDSTVIGSLVGLLAKQGIERIYVNTFFQRKSVQDALNQACHLHGVEWFEIPEERPTGTAGGVLHILNHLNAFASFNPNEPLLVLQGDAVSNVDLAALVNVHQANQASATVGCQIVADEDVPKFGIVATYATEAKDQSGKVRTFLEKPSLAQAGSSRLASTGFYVLAPSVFPYLKSWYQERLNALQAEAKAKNEPIPTELKEFDFAQDVFNMCLKADLPLYAQEVEGFWCDIGNPAQYVETLAMAYRGELGQVLPEPLGDYFDEAGVFYWQGTKTLADKDGLSLAGGVVVAMKQDPSAL